MLLNHKGAFHGLSGINKTAWGAKLIVMTGLVYPVGCASLDHLMMAQHCRMFASARLRFLTCPNLSPVRAL